VPLAEYGLFLPKQGQLCVHHKNMAMLFHKQCHISVIIQPFSSIHPYNDILIFIPESNGSAPSQPAQ
jgi:hypothetical protein